MNATIEIRVEPADPQTHLPHTFLIVRDGLGFEQGYGFAPQVTGLWGPGKIQSDTTHPFSFTSGQVQISDQQYARLAQYINDSINNPPYYNIPAQVQCTMWVNRGLQQAGVWDTLMIGADPYAQSLIAILRESVRSGFSDLTSVSYNQVINPAYKSSKTWVAPRRDPLVLDLDGDGIETVGTGGASTVVFDANNDGLKTGTGWVKADDGLLVLDRNGNGVIDSGAELFGVDTVLSNGRTGMDGFAALSDLDGNHDGIFDAKDAAYSQVRVWRDLNQDGVSQANELKTLAETGIASINLKSTAANVTLEGGNVESAVSTFTRTDGRQGTVGNLNLAQNLFYRSFTDHLDTSSVAALPDLAGSGRVRDLREAASLSAGLARRVGNYAVATTRAAQQAQLDGLLQAWAASAGMATSTSVKGLVPSFSGVTAGTAAYTAWVSKLTLLEVFNGETFWGVPEALAAAAAAPKIPGIVNTVSWSISTLSTAQMDLLDQSYGALRDSVHNGLLLQTRFKPYLDAINLTLDPAKGLAYDFSGVDGMLARNYAADPKNAVADLAGFGNVHSLHQAMAWDTSGHLKGLVQQYAGTTDPAARKAVLTTLIYAWAGVEKVDHNRKAANDDQWKVFA